MFSIVFAEYDHQHCNEKQEYAGIYRYGKGEIRHMLLGKVCFWFWQPSA